MSMVYVSCCLCFYVHYHKVVSQREKLCISAGCEAGGGVTPSLLKSVSELLAVMVITILNVNVVCQH